MEPGTQPAACCMHIAITPALKLTCLLCGCFVFWLQCCMCLHDKKKTLTDGAHDARQARPQGIFVAELQEAYAALHAGRALALPPLPVQYYDYAAWQRRRLGSGELSGSVEYWRRSLKGVPVLELPTDRPHPPGGISAAGGFVEVRVPVSTAAALRRLTAQCGTTLFTTMLSAWKVRCPPGAARGKSCMCCSISLGMLGGVPHCIWISKGDRSGKELLG